MGGNNVVHYQIINLSNASVLDGVTSNTLNHEYSFTPYEGNFEYDVEGEQIVVIYAVSNFNQMKTLMQNDSNITLDDDVTWISTGNLFTNKSKHEIKITVTDSECSDKSVSAVQNSVTILNNHNKKRKKTVHKPVT